MFSKHIFQPEWVTEIYYGGGWYPIKAGSYKYVGLTDMGEVYYYVDPYSDETVVVSKQVKGYKFRQPEEAIVIQLHEDL